MREVADRIRCVPPTGLVGERRWCRQRESAGRPARSLQRSGRRSHHGRAEPMDRRGISAPWRV